MNKVPDTFKINYSQCWEDTDILLKALSINNKDVILSITSGGDNSLALLSRSPKKLISIDMNIAQNYLLELKIAALNAFEHEKYISFISNGGEGAEKSFVKLKPHMSKEAYTWWKDNLDVIKKGVIHSGKFEKYLAVFRKYALPLIHSKKTIHKFLTSSTLNSQANFYDRVWNSKRWQLYFRISTSKFVLRKFARQKGMFKHNKIQQISNKYMTRLAKSLKNIPLQSNYFMWYCLTGKYGTVVPIYFQEQNFKLLRKNSHNLTIIHDSILTFLKKTPTNSITKFNLSDIFEALSQNECDTLWEEIIRCSKKGAIIAHWDNLLERTCPTKYSKNVVENKKLSEKLSKEDRVFFYGNFHVYTVK